MSEAMIIAISRNGSRLMPRTMTQDHSPPKGPLTPASFVLTALYCTELNAFIESCIFIIADKLKRRKGSRAHGTGLKGPRERRDTGPPKG